jgi:hypothetical protein
MGRFPLVFQGLSRLVAKSLTISVKHPPEAPWPATARKYGLLNDLAAKCDALAASARGSQ